MSMKRSVLFGAMALALATTPVMAAQATKSQTAKEQSKSDASKTPQEAEPGRWDDARKKAIDIGAQPARDVGMSKREIPPILQKAYDHPYSLAGLKSCKALAAEVTNLNGVLGPDYVVGNAYKENRAGKLAEAGGKTIINSIIPFRGLVREVTGAAPADRQMNAAVDAGLARRGFLRGVHLKQGCKTKF
ncbi:hypothetical protein B7G68_04490 [Caulobacter segnis]|uniref:Uncharacterized protein n=2 Tax=Caulobacter segnis TaxID=88688 RepID=D5VEW2_CAUST|nr:hypothetical protein [Caulobacter segnis]ADG09380.1 conserved hypothetical protein [Caulobacter segnis ATCC 21756]AVQ01182.1 hypothetical protein B7G68_04490 [Caulobacter segnis]